MKIVIFCLPELSPGKCNVKDERLDQVYDIVKSKKETYVQLDLVTEDTVFESDAILVASDAKTDLILKDLEFVETRLERTEEETELAILNKLKSILEKEEFIFKAGLSAEEKETISGYSLFTVRPVILADKAEAEDKFTLLSRALKESGYISFFTTAGEKETRAWLIKNGTTAWEAAGVVHSDIQKGFIRAEIIGFQDFINAGGENQAKQAGKLRLESKDYVMQDADWVNFRFNK